MTQDITAVGEPDPLERLRSVVGEIQSHRERIQDLIRMPPEDAREVALVALSEVGDTTLSLLQDMADAATNCIALLDEDVGTLLDDDESPDAEPDDEPLDSVLTAADGAEYHSVLDICLQMLRAGESQVPAAGKAEYDELTQRVDRLLKRTEEITLDDSPNPSAN